MLYLYKVEVFYRKDSRLYKTWYSIVEEHQNKTDAIKNVKDALVSEGKDPNWYYYSGTYLSNPIILDKEVLWQSTNIN